MRKFSWKKVNVEVPVPIPGAVRLRQSQAFKLAAALAVGVVASLIIMMTGFGADGSRLEKELDFEQVRGDFESNPFVTAVLRHIEAKSALGDELIARMKRVDSASLHDVS